ncbi:unnamed protein product [Cylicocyclus nassatus]|uniref:Uncharacterized protein n=1 Tax=Cylicocyclus nassatus TaxID=53992 RepID=A0AA36DLK8_CYLNA|nr:unnamed protein product [Cylicocyclus nassatus]
MRCAVATKDQNLTVNLHINESSFEKWVINPSVLDEFLRDSCILADKSVTSSAIFVELDNEPGSDARRVVSLILNILL